MNHTSINARLATLPLPAWPVIVALALGLRLVIGVAWWFVAESATLPLAGENYLYAGTDGYLQLAHTWLHTGEWAFAPGAPPVLHRPPMTVWLMALTTAWSPQYWFFNWLVVSLILSLVSLLALRKICRQLALPAHWQTIVLLVFSLHPMLAASVRATSFIQPGILMLLLVIATALHAKDRPSVMRLSLLGVTLAGAALTHGTFVLLLIIVPAWLLTQSIRLKAVGIPLLVAVVSISPWTTRNFQAAERFIPVVNGAGTQFWIARGIAADNDREIHAEYGSAVAEELEMSYYGTVDPKDDATLSFEAFNHFGEYIHEYAEGLYRFWVPHNAVYPAKRYADWLFVVPLAVLWLALSIRRFRESSLLSMISLMLWFVFAVFYPSTSYYLLVLPLIVLEIASYASTGEASTNSKTADSIAAAS